MDHRKSKRVQKNIYFGFNDYTKWLSEEALQIAEKRREVKSKGDEEIYNHLTAEFQRIARRDKKAFFSNT